MTLSVDLNADLGELTGPNGRASDRAILDVVTSCAIACGGHAGDRYTMEATLLAARERGVAAGAHPSYPDRKNFGRLSLALSPQALEDTLCEQMQALKAVASELDVPLTHIKPHGALYNDAARSAAISQIIVRSVIACFGFNIALIGQPGQETDKAARAIGLTFYSEGFIDRAYLRDGSLMPRSQRGSLLSETSQRVAQALQIVVDQVVDHDDGGTLPLKVQTLCLHGDSPGAADTALALKAALTSNGILMRALGALP